MHVFQPFPMRLFPIVRSKRASKKEGSTKDVGASNPGWIVILWVSNVFHRIGCTGGLHSFFCPVEVIHALTKWSTFHSHGWKEALLKVVGWSLDDLYDYKQIWVYNMCFFLNIISWIIYWYSDCFFTHVVCPRQIIPVTWLLLASL